MSGMSLNYTTNHKMMLVFSSGASHFDDRQATLAHTCPSGKLYCKTTNFGVSQNKVIWRLLNLASPVYAVFDRRHLRVLAATNINENTQFVKYNSTPKFVDLQYFRSTILFIRFCLSYF